MTTMINHGATGRVTVHSATAAGIFAIVTKWPRTADPEMSMSIMADMRNDSWTDFANALRLRSFFNMVRAIIAMAPTLPASVGVKNPARRPPITTIKINSGQNTCGTDDRRSFQENTGPRGPRLGLILHQPTTTKKNKTAIIMPGTAPARKSLPIDCSVSIAMMIMEPAGGIKKPSVPTLATTPVESFLLYPYLSISGIATDENVAEVARLDVVMALKSVAPTIVARARPPGTWPMNFLAVLYSSSAIPELKATCPISINKGI